MYVVSFVDFTPEPRFDGVSWTRVEIQESATQDGVYTLIDTLNVSVDADPAHPAPRSFTTANATLPAGWYIVTFLNVTGSDRSPVAPVHFVQSDDATFMPTVQQVARKILSRTRDRFGNLVGTFNADTEPTDTQVTAITGDVITEIADAIGDTIPEALWDDAANVASIRAAMQIELDFYSDQVNTGRSIYPQLLEQYKSALLSLQAAVTAAEGGDGSVVNTGGAKFPSYSFPDPGIGFGTRW